MARLEQLFWELVEVAVPNSTQNQLVFHWQKLLYVFEIVPLFGSILFSSNEVQKFVHLCNVTVAGVVSAQPGVILGEGNMLVATTGRVKIKVDATSRQINCP
jgi:hypothetical protein